MIKKIVKYAAAVIALSILSLSLCACATTVTTDRAFEALADAVARSLSYKTYFIEQLILKDNALDKTTVNVRCELDKDYNPVKEGDTYKDYKANIFVSRKDRDVKEIFCGPADAQNKTDPRKNVLFVIEFDYDANGKRIEKERKESFVSTEEFISGDEFKSDYSLESFLRELETLRATDIDFSIKNKKRELKNNVLTLSFAIKNDYITRFEEQNDKKSIFHDSSRVEIEIIYGRIASLITYREYLDERSDLRLESEPYKLFINYYGPKFSMPSYTL